MSLSPIESIRKNDEYRYIYENGKSYVNKYLIMYCLKNDSDSNRLGISVSKKVGNSVIRHRVKRVLREIMRLNGGSFHSGWDMVLIARTGAKDRDYKELESAVMHLAGLHKLV